MVARLNARFRTGHPSNELAEAGVLVRNFDSKTVQGKPWLPCPADMANGCAQRGDRFPGSLVNAQLQYISSAEPGFVLNPSKMELLCSYHADGASDGKVCEQLGVSRACIPGCWKAAGWHWGEAKWCERPSPSARRGILWGCAWRPDNLAGMMETHLEREAGGSHSGGYNEIIMDAQSWVANLPHTIEAVFFVRPSDAARASGVRADLMRAYNLAEGLAPPVVQYDSARTPDPFVLWHADQYVR